MKKLLPFTALGLFVAFGFTACETSGQNAMLGAATGAAIGGALHGRGDQALAGAAIGAAGGYLLGKAVQYDRRRAYSEGYYDGRGDDGRYVDRGYDRSYREPYPLARRTERDGFVTSPYYPYNRIDVRGIPRGAKVEDPSVGKIFINP